MEVIPYAKNPAYAVANGAAEMNRPVRRANSCSTVNIQSLDGIDGGSYLTAVEKREVKWYTWEVRGVIHYDLCGTYLARKQLL